MSGSRAFIYESLDELVGSSDLIIEATIGGTSRPGGGDDPTGVVADVVTQYLPEDLGTAPVDDAHPSDPLSTLTTSTVEVLQYGAGSPGQPPRLEDGETYLLFLNRSMLRGDLADAFFVTGAVAGIYTAGPGGVFERVSTEDPGLPAEIDAADLSAWRRVAPG